jgi:hypothetical protein
MDSGMPCTNLQCQVHACQNGQSTTITGKIMDPAGHNPLYNAVAYIPNSQGGKLDPIPGGITPDSCSCGALYSGEPMADALTAADGTFTIKNAPDGANIPLVVQIGKWRKEIIIPQVSMCQPNAIPAINLPKNLNDGMFASLPNIAVSTGGADTLECLLTRIGVDEAMFSGDPSAATARVHVFQGSGGNAASNPNSPSSPASLWDSEADLDRYDVVLFSCEGSPTTGADSTTAPQLASYVNKGGRVFAEHYHYAFFADYTNTQGVAFPQFANVADWNNVGLIANDAYFNGIGGVIQTTLPNNKPFPEGVALKTWLGNVGALVAGEIQVPAGNGRYNATVGATNVGTPWVQTDQNASPASTQYFSWDMPLMPPLNDAGVPEYCGRVVYSDMHVSGSANDYGSSTTVPAGCDNGATLSADEDAIEFILFDLSSCVTPVGYPPQPPPAEGGMPQ